MKRVSLATVLPFLLSACVFPSSGEEPTAEGDPTLNEMSSGGAATTAPTEPNGPSEGGGTTASGGNAMIPSPTGGTGSGGGGIPEREGPCDFPALKVLDVSSADALSNALRDAEPGTMIRLGNATYVGDFEASSSGTAADPIVLCGEAGATIRSDSSSQDSFNLVGDHWILSGFTVTGGLRGVVLDQANFNQLIELKVHTVGQEGIHLRTHSSDNIIEGCQIWNTGVDTPAYGEAIYIGSAQSNWSKYTGSSSSPDRSDRNQILGNSLGPQVRAEHIDVKEGTQGGTILDNTFDGTGISGENFADSWVDIKGNNYLVDGNRGANSPADAFQTHVVDDQWGHDIVFTNNSIVLNGPGYGFLISSDSEGVIVGCNNEVSAAGKGLSNRDCAVIP